MMTIKEFATLCGCNVQTLRYYDKIDLLKPVQVDPWSGYRYYTKSQAIDFVKIKNLQAADFSIGEIKVLLTMADNEVYDAFERKIAEQVQKLERIREIQQSYLTEMNTMKNMIYSFCDQLMERANDAVMLREFGMEAADAAKLVYAIRERMISGTLCSGAEPRKVNLVIDEESLGGSEAVEKMTFLLREEDMKETVYLNADNILRDTAELTVGMETIWEAHGWECAREFLPQFPELKDGERHVILVWHHGKAICDTLSYPLFMIGAILLKGYGVETDLHCFVDHSEDGQNHVALMRRM